MPLHLQPLRCPHCQYQISKADQANKHFRKLLLAREAVSCPKCEQLSRLPEQAEKLISVGLLISLIVAPLLMYWEMEKWLAMLVFALGAISIIVGAARQQLQPLSATRSNDEETNSPHATNDHPPEDPQS